MIIHDLKVVAIIIAPLFRAGKTVKPKPRDFSPRYRTDAVSALQRKAYFSSGFRNFAVTDCFR